MSHCGVSNDSSSLGVVQVRLHVLFPSESLHIVSQSSHKTTHIYFDTTSRRASASNKRVDPARHFFGESGNK